MIQKLPPMEIERRSFAIITELLGDRVLDPENEMVIKRVIHTTADFDYVDNLIFTDHAVARGLEALRNGCGIVTDTQMARAGISKPALGKLGGEAYCFISDPEVAQEAKERGVTDGTDPMGDITREQLATMLWRNAGRPAPGAAADLSRFSDSGTVSEYAQTAVRWAASVGILNGSDGRIDPQGTATRAQVAAMVARYGDRIA